MVTLDTLMSKLSVTYDLFSTACYLCLGIHAALHSIHNLRALNFKNSKIVRECLILLVIFFCSYYTCAERSIWNLSPCSELTSRSAEVFTQLLR